MAAALVPCGEVKSVKLFEDQVPSIESSDSHLQMSCSYLTSNVSTGVIALLLAARVKCPNRS